jgi:uncharacterized protein (DUF885 family)
MSRRPSRLAPPALLGAALALAIPVAHPATAGPELERLVERYFDELLELSPLLATYIGDARFNDRLPNSIGPEHRAQVKALDERYLADARRLDPAALTPAERVTWDIFIRERERALQAERFPGHLLPVNQAGSLLTTFAALGSGQNAQPFATVQDYENWLRRVDGFVVWIDQAIVNMREGIVRGIVQPRPVVEKLITQVEGLAVADPERSVFWGPVQALPDSFSAAERARLTAAYRAAIAERITPAYARLARFLREEYLPKARDSVGWTALPDGAAWYAFQVQEHTTTELTPAEIHEIGLREVARILGEMDGVRRKVGFDGDLHAFFAHLQTDPRYFYTRGADLVQGYRELKKRIDAEIPRLFSVLPKADYEVREVEAFRAQSSAGAFYQPPSADGSRPGIFFVNTFNLQAQPKYGMETLSLHEASPGHHFQVTIQQELQGLPRFRRFGGDYTAFVEGWALYAESLGHELGLFKDPYQYYGRLNDEQLRAMRLVVDTGLHAKGWSREQAIRYMLDNSSLAPSDVESEVERYIAWPGQALGYEIGDLRIQALRREAEVELGAKFDLRDFHREVLSDGAVPMALLEQKVERWIAARR